MKTLSEFQSFYNEQLISKLQELETERKKFTGKLFAMSFIFVVIGLAGFFGFTLFKRENSFYQIQEAGVDPVWIFMGVLIILFIIVLSFRIYAFSKKFTSKFKNNIIKEIVSFIDRSLHYSPENGISENEFMRSTIFTTNPDRYKMEDMVSGTIGSTSMKFSECHAEYKTTSTDSKGRSKTTWHTIFRGLFFIADFNKNFKSRTVVLPDTMEKMFGFLGKKLQSMNIGRDQLIKLEDPEFEKQFVVYGQDQVEARYILSTALMKRILDFRNKTKRDISLSFVNSSVFVAIPVNKDLFEPRIFRTVMNFDFLKEYYEYISITTELVEDLNLNTRIWNK